MVPRPVRGFTLLELVVVLVVLTLAAALAVPALSRQAADPERGLAALLPAAREVAARRGETIHLAVTERGRWTIEGAASAADGPIQTGAVEPFPGLPLTVIVSPVGSCGLDARSAAADSAIRLDPLTCTLLD